MLKYSRVIIIFLGLIGILGFINTQIKTIFEIKREGQTVFLELRPVDPRAFMLGDYMTLYYADGGLPKRDETGAPSGQAVLKLNANNIGKFVRLEGGSLATSEILINYARDFNGHATYGGSRYYFQEGTAELYEAAEFGVFKVAPSGRALLVGLADKNFALIAPKNTMPRPSP